MPGWLEIGDDPIIMRKIISAFFIVLWVSLIPNLKADEKIQLISTKPDDEFVSPDKRWTCVIKHAGDSPGLANNAVILRTKTTSILLWSYERHVDVAWTPDSRYFIINDIFFDKSSVLVFKLWEEQAKLIYQSPNSESVLDYYTVDAYRTKAVHLVCKYQTGSTFKVVYSQWVELNDAFLGIKQNIYTDEFEKTNEGARL